MRPELEKILEYKEERSINYFQIEQDAFKPFWHYHPELELTLITKGRGTRFIGDHVGSYDVGDLVFVGANLPHHWVSAKTADVSGAIVIQWDANVLLAIPECRKLKTLFDEAGGGIYFQNPSAEIIDSLYEFGELSSIAQTGQLMILLERLLLHDQQFKLSKSTFAVDNKLDKKKSRIAKSINYILDHLDERITVEFMAEFNHMAAPSFCRWFKQETGSTFVTFLNTARIEESCHHLRFTDMNVQSIAFMTGFESISHFNRVFKHVKGMSPGKFRRSIDQS